MRGSRMLITALLVGLAVAVIGFTAGALSSPRPSRGVTRTLPESDVDAYQALCNAEDRWLRAHAVEPAGDVAETERRRETLRDALAELGGPAGFTVDSVDCRATTCLAQLVWPDMPTAQARFRSVLHSSLGLQCARALFLREPLAPSSSYPVNLRIDCAAARDSS